MIEVLKVLATVVLFFGGSLLVSYCVVTAVSSKKHKLSLEVGTTVRLVGPGGAYRCHYLGNRDEHMALSSPIQADRYVPIRVGERIYVQAPGKNCMVSFRTSVVARDIEAHELIVETPDFVRKSERRSENRMTRLAGEDALVEGELAMIVNLSAAGACLIMSRRPAAGDRLHVVLPSSQLDSVAWALEATPDVLDGKTGYRVRMAFEEPLAGLMNGRA